VVLAALLLFASCGGRPDATQQPLSARSRPGHSPSPAAEDGEAVGAPTSAPPQRVGATAAPRAGRSPGPGATPEPGGGGADPAAPGLYRFTTQGTTQVADGPQRPMAEVTTLAVQPAQGRRQKTVRDLRDGDGSGAVIEQVLEYAPDGVKLVSYRLRTNFAGVGRTYTFDPQPPPTVLVPQPAPGWSTSFEMSGDGVTIRSEVRVTGSEQVRVDGAARETLVVEFSSTLGGALEGTQSAVNRIDLGSSLTLREDVRSDVRQDAVRVRTTYAATIRTLRPA